MREERTLISFDWALKSILRQKDNFDILEGFLTDLIGEKIEIIDLLESESNQANKEDKFNRVDLKAKDSTEREIIIEIQYDSEPDYIGRVYYGTCKTALENMKVGRRYADVKKVISVSIVYWQLLEKSYLVRGKMEFKDLEDNRAIELKKGQNIFAEYYFIQPEYFNDKIKHKIDEWVYMFKHSKVKGEVEATNIDKVQDKLDRLNMTAEEQKVYEEYRLNKMINEGVLQNKFDEGEVKGKAEGIIEGIERARAEMKAEGIADEIIKKIIDNIK